MAISNKVKMIMGGGALAVAAVVALAISNLNSGGKTQTVKKPELQAIATPLQVSTTEVNKNEDPAVAAANAAGITQGQVQVPVQSSISTTPSALATPSANPVVLPASPLANLTNSNTPTTNTTDSKIAAPISTPPKTETPVVDNKTKNISEPVKTEKSDCACATSVVNKTIKKVHHKKKKKLAKVYSPKVLNGITVYAATSGRVWLNEDASIINGTKNKTYAVGDKLPNGAIIKSINTDRSRGKDFTVTTTKGVIK